MKTYEYKGYTSAGATRKGLVEALHAKAARETLARDGILVERLTESGSRAKRVSPELRSILYRELSALLKAGMPLVTALDTLIKTPEMSRVGGILGTVRDQVREGSSLAQALAASRAGLSHFEQATLDVAERAASLELMLEQLADFLDERAIMKDQIQQALIYPTLVLGLGICVAVVMLGVLVPRTQALMEGTGAVPLLTRIMLVLGDGLWPWGLLVMAGAILSAIAWFRHVQSHIELRIRQDRFLFRVPILGRGYSLLAAIRFAKTLAILVRAGVSLVEGVSLAGRATGSAWLERLSDVESESLRHGGTLADTLRRIHPIGPFLSGWIEVGEASGSLAELLDRAADRCHAQWNRFLRRSLVLIEPALLLLVGGMVLLITLSVMLPMFSMTSAIAK
jgi:general secretion pathway protein F